MCAFLFLSCSTANSPPESDVNILSSRFSLRSWKRKEKSFEFAKRSENQMAEETNRGEIPLMFHANSQKPPTPGKWFLRTIKMSVRRINKINKARLGISHVFVVWSSLSTPCRRGNRTFAHHFASVKPFLANEKFFSFSSQIWRRFTGAMSRCQRSLCETIEKSLRSLNGWRKKVLKIISLLVY